MVIFPMAEAKEEQGRMWKFSVGVLHGFVLGWESCFWRSQMSRDLKGEDEAMRREDLSSPCWGGSVCVAVAH